MSSTQSIPFPSSGRFIEAVRESAAEARKAAGITIETDAVKRLVLSPSFMQTYQRLSNTHGLVFPFKFPNALAELNFLSLLSLLNFASGYRAPLHAITGRGAYDNIRRLVFSLYLSSSNDGGVDIMSAQGLKQITKETVAEMMTINLHVERPHESIPGLTVGELGGPGYDVVQLVTGAMNSTGDVLVNGGYKDLGQFVAEALQEGEKARKTGGTEAELNLIVERLVQAFPVLQDMALVNGKPVYCFKKAMILLHGVALRFGKLSPPPFPIPDTHSLPIFSDNVIPSMLVHLGVVDLSESEPSLGLRTLFPDVGKPELLASLLAPGPEPIADSVWVAPSSKLKTPPQDGPVLSVAQAFALRAAAIDACEIIVRYARDELDLGAEGAPAWLKELTLPEVDAWLWAVAKDRPDYRALARFALRDTVFF